MISRSLAAALTVSLLATTACSREGEIDSSGGITAVRTVCPAVGVPAATGDVTIFSPEMSRSADAIDVTALITNVRSTCNDSADPIVASITFDVLARRTRTDAAREVVLPYFSVVMQGGTAVVAKRIGRVAIRFEAGEARARSSAVATAYVNRAAATLPADVREQIVRKRKAGDQDAALDPLADPAVRQAVLRASFEALVGFQLTDEQLRYNATR